MCAVCLVLLVIPVVAQFERRVTIVTTRNETIEGQFITASGQDVLVRVAGQPLRVPLESISTLSFGHARVPERRARISRHPMEAAVDALHDMEAATRAGMLRPQYNDVVLAAMPHVDRFLRAGDGWADVRLAVAAAATLYQKPLEGPASWQNAEQHWREAGRRLEYADRLVRDREERDHQESPELRQTQMGMQVNGRLGTGDRQMPQQIDRSSVGAFNDVWELEVAAATGLVITMESDIFQPHLTLVDSTGRKLEGDMGYATRSEIRKTVPAGTYTIWAGAATPREIGTYSLMVRAR